MIRLLFALAMVAMSQVSHSQLEGKVICIDPGHPSEVGRGTKGKKLTEMEVVWNMAQLLKPRLEKLGAKVVFTKNTLEEFVKNKDRAGIANQAKADLMVRLHCDAADGSGFATYYPTQQGTSQGFTGPTKELLQRLPPIAIRFHVELAKCMKGLLPDLGLKSDLKTAVGAKQGALTGSIYSQVPVVLVELIVLTNPADEAFIASKKGQNAFAEALVKAVVAAIKS